MNKIELRYSNGKTKEKFEVKELDSEIKDGKYESWYENGITESEGEYIDNVKFGYWKFWTDKGTLKEEGEYFNDEKGEDWKNYEPEISSENLITEQAPVNVKKLSVEIQSSDFSMRELGELSLNEALEIFKSFNWKSEFSKCMEMYNNNIDNCPPTFYITESEGRKIDISPYYYSEDESMVSINGSDEIYLKWAENEGTIPDLDYFCNLIQSFYEMKYQEILNELDIN